MSDSVHAMIQGSYKPQATIHVSPCENGEIQIRIDEKYGFSSTTAVIELYREDAELLARKLLLLATGQAEVDDADEEPRNKDGTVSATVKEIMDLIGL